MILAVLAAIVCASAAYADTLSMVDPGEGNYTSTGDTRITITGSQGKTIENAVNIIPAGGTIILNGNFKLTSQNGSYSEGGGINLDSASVDIINCRITGNKAGTGGGIYFVSSVSATAVNCDISGNTPQDVYGPLTVSSQASSAEAQEQEPEQEQGYEQDASGGGCSASYSSIILLAVLLAWRKHD